MSGDSVKPDPKTSPEAAESEDRGKAAPGGERAGAPATGPGGSAVDGQDRVSEAAPARPAAGAKPKPVVKKAKPKKAVRKAKRSVKKKATPKKRAAAKAAHKELAAPADLAQRPLDMPKLEAPLAPDLADRPEAPPPRGRARWLFATLVLVLAIGAAVYWTQQAPMEPTEPGPAPQTAALAGSDQVKEIETILLNLNFDPGEVDGVADAQTREAISLFQEFADLPVNGEPSEALLGELREIALIMAGDG